MQALAFAVELLSPLALWHPRATLFLCLAWAAFHLGVFACSGLLFWDWVLADLALAYAVALLPASVADQAGRAHQIPLPGGGNLGQYRLRAGCAPGNRAMEIFDCPGLRLRRDYRSFYLQRMIQGRKRSLSEGEGSLQASRFPNQR